MKFMVCIADKRYGSTLIQHLNQKGFRVTKLSSTGGFLKQGNDTLLIGINNEDIDRLKEELKEAALSVEKTKRFTRPEHRYTTFLI